VHNYYYSKELRVGTNRVFLVIVVKVEYCIYID